MTKEPKTVFLPNFCGAQAVFLLVLAAELLALALALAQGGRGYFWTDLALLSLFVQWTALVVAAVLCMLRRTFALLGTLATMAVSFMVVLGVTLIISLAAEYGAQSAWYLVGGQEPAAGFVMRNLAIAALVALVALRYLYVQHQWRLNVAAEARAREQALTARIRPHFLFNSLNTIASLAHTQPAEAETAVLDLADLFRAALQERERLPLAEEIDLARGYLRIESLRLGMRLKVDWQLAADLPLDLPVPALILQPLVENAVHHGIEPSTGGGTVTVAARREGDLLLLEVTNPLPPIGSAPGDGSRIAQDNVRQRLALAYGDEGRFAVTTTNGVYCVRVHLPMGIFRDTAG